MIRFAPVGAVLLLSAISVFAPGCAVHTIGPALPPHATHDRAAHSLFEQQGMDGAFVLLHAPSQRLWVVGGRLAIERRTPASTFKLPNTLIGLWSGVISGEDFTLPWDGVKRWNAPWNRDHALKSALRESVVWFYQEVARRIGSARMQVGLNRLEYGNLDQRGGIDRFWLDGKIAISPYEQMRFVEKLWAGTLGVSREHQALLKRLLTRYEERGERVWRGKTGTALRMPENIGWLVGGVDAPDGPWIYALMVRAPNPDMKDMLKRRITLCRALLQHFGAWPR